MSYFTLDIKLMVLVVVKSAKNPLAYIAWLPTGNSFNITNVPSDIALIVCEGIPRILFSGNILL
jgi:hypothetical protein